MADHVTARLGDEVTAPLGDEVTALTEHLRPEVMAAAERALVRKAIAEFAHERLIDPRATGDDTYELPSDDGRTRYRFRARRLSLDHWLVDGGSIERHTDRDTDPDTVRDTDRDTDRGPQQLDALGFVLDLRDSLGIPADVVTTYLEELASTLHGAAYKRTRCVPHAKELIAADFQTVEAAMSEGHPGFVANNGRIGFDAADYRAFAPEAGRRVRLVWVAVRRTRTTIATSDSLDVETLLTGELGADELARLRGVLEGHGLDPDAYHLVPVHPWQWVHKIAVTLAPDVARRDVVPLGEGRNDYLPQQSIRTLFNASDPARCYVKTSLSILNMGFTRGLSPGYMAATPAISDWVHDLVDTDPYLRRKGFSILREVAAVGYEPRHYSRADPGSGNTKLLSALWRESPVPGLGSGERLATMAALLHTDEDGSYLAQLVAESGLDPVEWLHRYLDAYLTPLLHCFYAYGLVFMPHGENLIMVLRDHVPVRMIMKDIGEEVALLDDVDGLPESVRRIRAHVPDDVRTLSILTDVFDGIFRYLNAILVEHAATSEQEFWRAVAECVTGYQRDHPGLAGAFASYDLFAPEFARSCLNRLQLRNNQQMVDLADPASALAFAGTLENPIAGRQAS